MKELEQLILSKSRPVQKEVKQLQKSELDRLIVESFLGEATNTNLQKFSELFRSRGLEVNEKAPSTLVIKTDDRQKLKDEIEQELSQYGFVFSSDAPGSGFGRFELRDRVGGNVYILLKPTRRGAAQAGQNFELSVANTMKELLGNVDVKTAGFGHGSDLTISSPAPNVVDLNMELKTSTGADFGQFKLAYDVVTEKWEPVKTKKYLENEELFEEIFRFYLAPELEGKKLPNPDDPVYNRVGNKIVGLKRSPETGAKKLVIQRALFGERADLIIPIDPITIVNYYEEKGDSLIIIQGKGVYALNATAKLLFKVPYLEDKLDDASVRFRVKPHGGTNGDHSFTPALKVKLEKSNTAFTDQKFLDKIYDIYAG